MTIFIASYPKALMRFTIKKKKYKETRIRMVAWRMEVLCYMYNTEGRKTTKK